jgi:hypothetical protein
VSQPVKVDGVLVAACNRRRARHHHLEHRVLDASGSRRSRIASASRRHTPSLRSASRNSSRPPFDDWLPPSKSTVSFLRWRPARLRGKHPLQLVNRSIDGGAPAIAGAVAELTGVRLRHTPFTPDRVKKALG